MPGYVAANLLTTATLQYRDASDTVKTPSTIGQFPLSFVADTKPGRVFKWAAVELANIRAGFGAPVAATCVGLINHNFAADSVHVLEYSADGSNWFLAATLTPDRTRYYLVFPTQTALFWRLRTTSWGSQAATPYLGELWLGQLVTLPRGFARGLRKGVTGFTSGVRTSFGQQERSLKSSFESAGGRWAQGMTDAELASMDALVTAVGFDAGRFLFIYDLTVPTCWIARLGSADYRPSLDLPGIWNDFAITINEEPFGAPVA